MSFDKSEALDAAKQYVLQRNVQAAVDIYRKIIQDDPSDLDVNDTLGDLYASNGQVHDAITQFTRVADAYIEHGLARKAIATLKKIIAIDPGNTETATKLADLYGQAGLPSEARQHYLEIADALTRKGATLDALEVFSKVVELDPSNTSTRIKLGELYLREAMNEQAFEAFVTAARQLDDKGENRRALNAYNEALSIKPDNRDALAATRKLMTLLGVPSTDKVRNSDKPHSVEAAGANPPQQLSSAHPITSDLGANSDGFVIQEISKAEILVAYGKVSQAVSMLRKVLEDRPDNIDVHIKLKDIYLRTGMTTEAASECIALERIHEARGESERARDYAVRASRLTQLMEQPSGDLPKPRQKPAEQPALRLSPPPPEVTPQPDLTPKPDPPASRVDPRPLEPARMAFSAATSNLPSVEVASLDVSGEPQISDLKLVESAIPVAGINLSISPAHQSALVPVARALTTKRERELTSLVGVSSSVDRKRDRLTARAIAAGVFVLLGTTAVIGGLAYNAHLDNQYVVLSAAAPPITQPAIPAVEDQSEPLQPNEVITVEVTPPTQTDAAANRQNQESVTAVPVQPASPQPSSEPPRVITPPAPMPPRAIASPDARGGGTETRTPSGVPGDVPIGTANTAEPPPKLVRQSPGVLMGGAIKKVDPVYPATARVAHQAGAVSVEVTISEQGNVTSARALSGPEVLRNAAVAAARGWKFKASTLGGVPVTTTTTIVFNFKL